VAFAALAALVTPASGRAADKVATRLVLDHVDVQPSYFADLVRVRLYVTAVTLEGGIIPINGTDGFLFQLGGSKQRIPYLLGRFAGTEAEVAAAVVLEVGNEYEADIPIISDALSRHLREWPASARVTLVRYGAAVDIDPRPRNVRSVAASIASSNSDLAAAPPKLIEAVDRALKSLERAEPSTPGVHLRKVVVVISDGKDAEAEPADYRRLGEEAKNAGVRIHTVAYSPVDNRLPLRGLGELSKRSQGTFRWVRSLEGFDPQLRTLAAELAGQYVATIFLPLDQLATAKRVAVKHKELTSDALELPPPRCASATCANGSFCAALRCVSRTTRTTLLTWVLYGVLAVALVVLVLAVAAAFLRRSENRSLAAQQRAAQIMSQQAQAQAAQNAHRIVAHGPQGQRIDPAPVQARGAAPPSGGRIAGIGPGGAIAQPSSAPAPLAPAQGYLAVMTGTYAGKRLQLRHGFLIGSGPECDLCIADPAVSRYHAQIGLDAAGGVILIDKGSANGTFVNGTRVTQMRLGHGNLIRVGSTEIRYLTS